MLKFDNMVLYTKKDFKNTRDVYYYNGKRYPLAIEFLNTKKSITVLIDKPNKTQKDIEIINELYDFKKYIITKNRNRKKILSGKRINVLCFWRQEGNETIDIVF